MLNDLTTRRLFIQKGLTLLAAAQTIPLFLDHTAMALADPTDVTATQRPSGKDGKILVIVQLSGGNDGLNTVVPYADDAYHRVRSGIGISADNALRLNDYAGLHPNLAPLKALYDDGELSIVQGVGYPNPNRSHFRSMDIWHSGQPTNELPTTGWLGRYFDNACPGCDPHVGVSIGESLPLAMHGQRVTPLAFERPDAYRYRGQDVDHYLKLNEAKGPVANAAASKKIVSPAARKPVMTPTSELEFLTRTAMDAQVSSDTILSAARGHNPTGVDYPRNEFGQGLRTIAAMIKGELPTRVYYVTLGGFDTHANQRGRHDNLMTQFAQGVSAFWKDIKQQENDQRVLMLTFSEFGRRVEQNASNGTDHGAAAPMFLVGKSLKPGLHGRHPSLTDLDQGDLKWNIDFRSVYATVLQEWLETPSKPILGQQFKPLAIL